MNPERFDVKEHHISSNFNHFMSQDVFNSDARALGEISGRASCTPQAHWNRCSNMQYATGWKPTNTLPSSMTSPLNHQWNRDDRPWQEHRKHRTHRGKSVNALMHHHVCSRLHIQFNNTSIRRKVFFLAPFLVCFPTHPSKVPGIDVFPLDANQIWHLCKDTKWWLWCFCWNFICKTKGDGSRITRATLPTCCEAPCCWQDETTFESLHVSLPRSSLEALKQDGSEMELGKTCAGKEQNICCFYFSWFVLICDICLIIDITFSGFQGLHPSETFNSFAVCFQRKMTKSKQCTWIEMQYTLLCLKSLKPYGYVVLLVLLSWGVYPYW